MSMPGVPFSRRRKGWIALTAVAALGVLAFGAPRLVDAVRRLVDPPASNIIIVVPEGAETV
jgi:hypothetical protein